MKIKREVSDDYMIAEFLKAEVNSDRFSPIIINLLNKLKINKDILISPDTNNLMENKKRRELLTVYRGYQADQHIFQNFPDDVKWFEATITKDELDKVMYINWEYWLEISDGNRSPKYVAQKISSGKLPDDKEIRRFKTIAQEIKLGIKLPRLILIAENVSAQLVVLEGHARITALMLILESLPKNIEVIVGFSKKMMNYGLYNAEAWQD